MRVQGWWVEEVLTLERSGMENLEGLRRNDKSMRQLAEDWERRHGGREKNLMTFLQQWQELLSVDTNLEASSEDEDEYWRGLSKAQIEALPRQILADDSKMKQRPCPICHEEFIQERL